MVHKYPLMRPMILLKSTIEVTNNKIIVSMKIKGADNYKVEFVENINEEDAKALEERREQSKNMAIQKALEHMAIGEQIAEEMANKKQASNPKNQKSKTSNNQNPLPPTGDMPPIPPPPDMPPVMEEPEEDTPLICGRNPNLRTNIIKVVDISPDDDMAAISGEILGGSIEEKECV